MDAEVIVLELHIPAAPGRPHVGVDLERSRREYETQETQWGKFTCLAALSQDLGSTTFLDHCSQS